MTTTISNNIPSVVFHPGETLSEKLEEMGMSIKEFAVRTSKPEKTIIAVIKGDSIITSDMSVSFESVTKIPAHFWMNKQRAYDEYIARERRESLIQNSTAWTMLFPVADMIKKGWLAPCKTPREKVIQLFSFFGVSTSRAWEDYYFNQQLKVAFRISLANIKEPYAISAWLRRGELQAFEQQIEMAYTDKRLKEFLPQMKTLMATHPEDFASRLQMLCLQAGVKLVYTPCLPKAPISGSTRWLNDTPCIQLSGLHKRNDIFWFSFFHEVGHILLHGKKDIFLENIDYTDKQLAKEHEADDFASKIVLSPSEEAEIIASGDYTLPSIRYFAEKFNTHPGIIVGRLQYLKVIPYWQDQELIAKVDLDAINE